MRIKDVKFGMGAALVLAVSAIAGSPGYELVEDCVIDLGQIEDNYNAKAQGLLAAAEAKLAQLDDRGASDERLAVEALKFIDRLTSLEFATYRTANKTTQRYFVRIINLDETNLIDQLSDADVVRDQSILDIGSAGDDYEDAVTEALNSEQND